MQQHGRWAGAFWLVLALMGFAVTAAAETASFKILDLSERELAGRNQIVATLSEPADSSRDLAPFLSVRSGARELPGGWVLSEDRRQLHFAGTEPDKTYRVTLRRGLPAASGARLGQDHTLEITTRPLPPAVDFKSRGSVLPLGYARGLPVEAVNVSAVDVDFFRVKTAAMAEFMRDKGNGRVNGWQTEQLSRHAEHIHTGRFELPAPANTRREHTLPVHTLAALQQPGIYFAVMRIPGEFNQRALSWFSITDLGLHLRRYDSSWRAQVNNLITGAPMAGVQIKLLNRHSAVLAQTATDATGAAELPPLRDAQVLVAEQVNQYAVLALNAPALDLSAFETSGPPQRPQEIYMFGPRDLYRPGETATVHALLRGGDGEAIAATPHKVELFDATNRVQQRFTWTFNQLGRVTQTFKLPAGAATGRWRLVAAGPDKTRTEYAFNVEDFLPETLELTLAGPEPVAVAGADTPLQLTAQAEHFYGAKAVGNPVEGFVETKVRQQAVAALPEYYFGRSEPQFQARLELPQQALDDSGRTTWKLPPPWAGAGTPLLSTATVSVLEDTGRPVTRRQLFHYWPGGAQLGIRPHFGESAEARTEIGFDLVAADADGKLTAAEQVRVALIRADRNYFWSYDQGRGWHWQWSDKEYEVATDVVTLSASSPTEFRARVDYGNYRIEVTELGGQRSSSFEFFAGEDWYRAWAEAEAGGAPRPDRVQLTLDRAAYKSGETARVRVLPPAASQVTLLVEGDGVLWEHQLAVPADGAIVEIPIADAWQRHDLYITALAVQGAEAAARVTPKRSIGITHLSLDRSDRRANLSIAAPELARPETDLEVELTLPELAGQTAEVTLALVDAGVLAITDFKTPDPFSYFFARRRYSARLLDNYADVIERSDASTASQRFGGGLAASRGGEAPAGDVQIVALAPVPVTVGADGRAKVRVKLPYFNGRLRLMATAWGAERYASAERDITVRAPVVTELARPRFLARGDSANLTLSLTNMEPQAATISLNAELSGAGELAFEPVSETLAPGAKLKVPLQVSAHGPTGALSLSLELISNDITTRRQFTLGLRPPYSATTVSGGSVVPARANFSLPTDALAALLPSTARAQIALAPAPELSASTQVQELMGYPYGCLEQRTSRGFALLAAAGMADVDEAQRQNWLQAAVAAIGALQRPDGSFAMWNARDQEAHWLTAYATDFLLSARAEGVEVPERVLDQALARLGSYIEGRGELFDQPYSEVPAHYAIATRAYAAEVLSRLQRAPLGQLRSLAEAELDGAVNGLPAFWLARALSVMGDPKLAADLLARGRQLDTAAEQHRRNAPGRFAQHPYLGEYGSPLRDLAFGVLLAAGPSGDTAALLQRGEALARALHGESYLSTQERALLVRADRVLAALRQQPWQARFESGGGAGEAISATGVRRFNLDGEAAAQQPRWVSQHDAPLFASYSLTGYSAEPPAADAHGFAITRQFYNLKGEPVQVDTVRPGEVLLVRFSVSANERIADGLLVQLLPAGFELENQNLNHVIKLDQISIEGRSASARMATTQIVHQEWRDDRYVAAFDHHAGQVSEFFCLWRAVTPGQYGVPGAQVEAMYRPEIRARGAAQSLTVSGL